MTIISKRKEKKLLSRGNRIQRVAQKHFQLGPHKYTEKYGRVNKTSDMLSDLYSFREFTAIDQHMLLCAY